LGGIISSLVHPNILSMALIEEQRGVLTGHINDVRCRAKTNDLTIINLERVRKTFAANSNSQAKYFRRREGVYEVLNDIDLKINEGEIVTIVGPSGCGKSTLLNIIAGLDKPDSGLIQVKTADGVSSKSLMIFQEGALFPWLCARENVEFGLRLSGNSAEQSIEIANKYLKLVGLESYAEFLVHQLSGGMKQRVAIARALAMNPDVLLLDEPFAALDYKSRELLNQELLDIHAATKKTMLFVTHNINEAIQLGDRVVVMSASQKTIGKEFVIEVPRPRDLENPTLIEVKRQILSELKEDLQIASRGR
jgi:NitT/TauT family transport system ATP-binding protein